MGLPTTCSLSKERLDAIAHAIAEERIMEVFRLVPLADYRARLQQVAPNSGIKSEEMHQFILTKLPKSIRETFGWQDCSISGTEQAKNSA